MRLTVLRPSSSGRSSDTVLKEPQEGPCKSSVLARLRMPPAFKFAGDQSAYRK